MTNAFVPSDVTRTHDQKGSARLKEGTLVDRLLLTPEQLTWVRQVAGHVSPG